MAEPLSRMGAATSAIDAAPENIEAAKAHALMESNQHIGKLVLSWA